MNGGPLIDGKLTRLRPPQAPADIPFLQTLWNDGKVMRHVGFPAGLGMTEKKMARWWDKSQHWTATHLIVETLDGRPIGESGWGFQKIPGLLEIKLSPAHWGKGYASDALGALIEYIWDWTSIEQLVVTPHRENRAARYLYRRFGFQSTPPPSDFDCGDGDYWTLARSQPPPTPHTLIFDWGGVLMRTEDDRGRRRWEARLELPAGGADQAVFKSDAWRQAQLGQCTVEQCWNAIGASLGLAPAALAEFRHAFWAGDQLDHTLIQRIRQWQAAGYPIALLSNYSPELDDLLDEHQLRPLFSAVTISAYEGSMKPASQLYWRALRRIGINPAEGIFVDDFAANVAGARNVGLHAIHFQDSQQAIAEIGGFLS